jgi:hypothetical protein
VIPATWAEAVTVYSDHQEGHGFLTATGAVVMNSTLYRQRALSLAALAHKVLGTKFKVNGIRRLPQLLAVTKALIALGYMTVP